MASEENQSQKFIYIRSLKEKVPCTELQFKEFYREATRIRRKNSITTDVSILRSTSGLVMVIVIIANII